MQSPQQQKFQRTVDLMQQESETLRQKLRDQESAALAKVAESTHA